MEQLLIVLSNPHDGRDDEFNEWYSHVHIRDVIRLSPGAIGVQRFRLAPLQFPAETPEHRYLAVYEAETHSAFVDGHAGVFTPVMPISDAFRFDDMREAFYEPLAARCRRTDRSGAGDVILERIASSAGGEAFIEWYVAERLPAILRLQGVTEGVFSRVAAEQMLPLQPDSHYIALYRTDALADTLRAWPRGNELQGASLSCYTPLLTRLTAEASRHPGPEQAEREASARAALGERVYQGFPETMA